YVVEYVIVIILLFFFFFFSSRRRHTRLQGDWSSDVCSSDLSSTATTDCELIVVDRRDFTALVRDDPKIALAMIGLLCARLRWASQQFEEVVFLNLPGRLAKLLGRLGVKSASGGPQKLAITQRELSQLTNTSRESINKQLQVWAKLKWLRLERGGIVVLAPDAIAAIAAAGTERELA